jgi:hypothetical protein
MTRRARFTVTLIWALVQLIVFVALVFCTGVLAAFFDPNDVPIGFIVGAIVGLWVCHSARRWLLRLRLRLLRRNGIAATATVTRLERDWRPGARGSGVTFYAVQLRWDHPSGEVHKGEWRYRFIGRGSPGFEKTCADHKKITVRYREQRPDRFCVDIPFAPRMAELVGPRRKSTRRQFRS